MNLNYSQISNDLIQSQLLLIPSQNKLYLSYFYENQIQCQIQNFSNQEHSELSLFLRKHEISMILIKQSQSIPQQLLNSILKENDMHNIVKIQVQEFQYLNALATLSKLKFQQQYKEQILLNLFQNEKDLLITSGVLLSFLEQKQIVQLADFEISNIIFISNDKTVQIQIKALFELDIYSDFKTIKEQRVKGIFTIYDMLRKFCSSSQGGKLFKQIFLTPVNDTQLIKQRHENINFLNQLGRDTIQDLQDCIKKIKNYFAILYSLNTKSDDINKWKYLQNSLNNTKMLLEHIKEISIKDSILNEFKNYDIEEFEKLLEVIEQVIIFDDKKISINDDICEELDQLRKDYYQIDEIMAQSLQQLIKQLPQEFKQKDIKIIFLIQVGYLIKMNQRDLADVILQYDDNFQTDWEFQWEDLGYSFYKDQIVCDLDSEYGDLKTKIKDRELTILRQLYDYFKKQESFLRLLNQRISNLDVLIAFSSASIELKLKQPQFVDQNQLIIQNGFNIQVQNQNTYDRLNKRQPFSCVKNNTLIIDKQNNQNFKDDDQQLVDDINNKCQIITGAKYSGKTRYLQQIGVIVYLSHIGSFVPAQYCQLGTFDAIYTHFSLYKNLPFLEELTQVSQIMHSSTNRSLVLMDDFGQNAENNHLMFLSVVKIFSQLDFKTKEEDDTQIQYNRIPISIFSTHFNQIFQNDLIKETKNLTFYQMKTQVEKDTIKYFYQLQPGWDTKSQGLKLAEQFIQDKNFIERYYYLQEQLQKGKKIKGLEEIKNIGIQKFNQVVDDIKNGIFF